MTEIVFWVTERVGHNIAIRKRVRMSFAGRPVFEFMEVENENRNYKKK